LIVGGKNMDDKAVLEILLEVLNRIATRFQGIESSISAPKREEDGSQGRKDGSRSPLDHREGHVGTDPGNMISDQPHIPKSPRSSFASSALNANNSTKSRAPEKNTEGSSVLATEVANLQISEKEATGEGRSSEEFREANDLCLKFQPYRWERRMKRRYTDGEPPGLKRLGGYELWTRYIPSQIWKLPPHNRIDLSFPKHVLQSFLWSMPSIM
jgi:hypothetical protein